MPARASERAASHRAGPLGSASPSVVPSSCGRSCSGARGLGRAALGRAVGIGIVSHLVLDLATHNHDVVLWPGLSTPGLGLGLYGTAPMVAFAIELGYGAFCWWIYREGRGLLALVVLANVANLSLFSSAIPGPEEMLAGHPLMIVTLVAAQIAATLALVGVLARRRSNGAGASAVGHASTPSVSHGSVS